MIRGRYQFSKVIGFFFNDVSRKEHSEIFGCSSGRGGGTDEKSCLHDMSRGWMLITVFEILPNDQVESAMCGFEVSA